MALSGLLLLGACITQSEPAYPLYADSHPPWPKGEVARLMGYVQYVDGYDVSELGKVFDLAPGCHVVGTPEKYGRGDDSGGATMVTTGTVGFAIMMKKGHDYVFEVRLDETSMMAYLVAMERGPDGTTLRALQPAQSNAELNGCLAQGPGVVVPGG